MCRTRERGLKKTDTERERKKKERERERERKKKKKERERENAQEKNKARPCSQPPPPPTSHPLPSRSCSMQLTLYTCPLHSPFPSFFASTHPIFIFFSTSSMFINFLNFSQRPLLRKIRNVAPAARRSIVCIFSTVFLNLSQPASFFSISLLPSQLSQFL